ncbi:MAG: VWA domain-containing protein, partial [Pseudomonadales bacterium]|nr:VWA domain-containing protein [Pseudomonadales bacterium]
MIDWLIALWPQHWMRPWWLLALVPALLLFYGLWRSRHSQSQWQQVIDPALLKHLLHNPLNMRARRNRAWPIGAATLASCIGIVALAGPAWEKLPQPPQRTQHTLVLIADLTLSMHTQDIAPSRLTRMRYKLLELLARRKEGQTALIAYSGDAHLVSPLTDDAATIAALVPALSPEIMPSIGSNASAAFALADTMLEGIAGAKRIVWLTDEVLPRDRETIRSVVARHHIELLVIGIGTAAGGPV